MVRKAAGIVLYRLMAGRPEFLLLQASYPPHHWTPAKGHLDGNESEWACAVRETEEETGVSIGQVNVVSGAVATLNYKVGKQAKVVRYWLGEVPSNAPVSLSEEHQNFEWTTSEKAKDLVPFADMQQLLRTFALEIGNRDRRSN